MKVRAVDFVEIRVTDMDRTLHFYRETLGMRFPLTGKSPDWKELQSPPLAVAFGLGPEPPGAVILALAVDDLSEAVEELRSQDVPILSELREQDVCYRAIIQAPDGNVIVLHHRKDGTAG
ncbi:MAG TPA: VOC family protein [Candidatus Cybelea sp.]|jgi:predicted enzyme related to lactoylglutathione lyase